MTISVRVPTRAVLEAARQKLADRRDVRERLAFAEACFRLAVLPDTDIEASIELMREAADSDPYHPKFWFHLGRLLHKNGDPQAAVTAYLRALKQVSKSHRILVHLALALNDLDVGRREAGARIMAGLQAGDDEELANLVAELESSPEQTSTARRGKGSQETAANESPEAKEGSGEPGKSRWKGLWQLLLMGLLARSKPMLRKAVQQMKEGRNLMESGRGVAEYAVASLFFAMDSPKACRQIEGWLREPALAPHQERPAIRLVQAVCELSAAGTATEFVERAAAKMAGGELPPELGCALHYCWHGVPAKDVVQATAPIDSYPDAIRSLDCFRELRLALLDHHARAEWTAGRSDRAEILWRETIRLDPYRIPVAHNLAIAATRAKSEEKYSAAWDRAAELRYLLAAAAGDLRVEVDDRRKLHRSFAQQSRLRHVPESGPGSSKDPTDSQLRAWMKDRDALNIWLQEGELLYLNSRLRFRSPIHILGLPKDSPAEDAELAKRIFVRQFAICFRGKRWAGVQVFLQLAEQLAERACSQVRDPVARNRDAHFLPEEAEAFKLASEAVRRGFLMFRMVRLASADTTVSKLAGLEVSRFLVNMPWKNLSPVAAKNGYDVSDAGQLVEIFLSYVGGLVPDAKDDAAGAEAALGAVEDCLEAAPESVSLRLVLCQLLLKAKRNKQVYEMALTAISLAAKMTDREDAALLGKQLAICMDNAALAEIPERLLSPSRADVPETVREGRRVLIDFPRAGALRILMANYLIQTADEDSGRLKEAILLLEEGLDLFVTEQQVLDARRLLEKAGSRSRSPDALARIRTLLESASAHARSAVAMVQVERSPSKVRQARAELEAGISDAVQAEEIATGAELPAAAQSAREIAADLQKILEGLERQ